MFAFLTSCSKEPEADLLLQPSNDYQTIKKPITQVKPKEKFEDNEEKVIISIENFGRMDPFLPYKEKNLVINSTRKFSEIPLPPDINEEDPVLNQLTQAKVTGILYDRENPSAIINIAGEEHLVRDGDVISDFYIEGIQKEYVVISAGLNTFKAHIGEVIDGTINYSNISDIESKFAGSKYNKIKEDKIFITPINDIKNLPEEDEGKPNENTSDPFLSSENIQTNSLKQKAVKK